MRNPQIHIGECHSIASLEIQQNGGFVSQQAFSENRLTTTVFREGWPVEICNVSQHGLWVLLDAEELLLPFDQFPWFRSATIDQICTVERPTDDHLSWRKLDIDLFVQSIRNQAEFPLVSR